MGQTASHGCVGLASVRCRFLLYNNLDCAISLAAEVVSGASGLWAFFACCFKCRKELGLLCLLAFQNQSLNT